MEKNSPFKMMKNVPLVGQPYQIRGFSPTLMIECKICDAREHILITATPGMCTSCGTVFKMMEVTCNLETGNVTATIGHVLAQKSNGNGSTPPS